MGCGQSFARVSSAITASASARCAGVWQKITERYCEPTSLPWRSLVVGSWIEKNTRRRSREESGMARLLPREGKFFDYFNDHAGHAVLAAVELRALLANLGDLEARRRNIERHEKQADQITHHTMQLLHQTFITPLDRDEIHQLITTMDDVLDLMEDIAQCLFLYDVRTVTTEAQRLAEICVGCTEKVRDAVASLESMENTDAI